MVLRFASQKLLNLYFKCSILHLIKYIQRNKESKEKKTQQNAAWLFLWEWWRRRKCVWAVLCMKMYFVSCDKCFRLRYAWWYLHLRSPTFIFPTRRLSYSENQQRQDWNGRKRLQNFLRQNKPVLIWRLLSRKYPFQSCALNHFYFWKFPALFFKKWSLYILITGPLNKTSPLIKPAERQTVHGSEKKQFLWAA